MPEGATLFEARDSTAFRRLVALHTEKWYKYTVVTRGRDAPNGSLYLITGCIKTKAWGNAVFDRPSTSEDHFKFISQGKVQGARPKYSWNKAGPILGKTGPSVKGMIPDSDELINQCVFLRGYRIMLRHDRWDVIKKTQTMSSQEITSANPQLMTRNSWNYGIIRSLLPINKTRRESGSTTINDTFSVAPLVSNIILFQMLLTIYYTLAVTPFRCSQWEIIRKSILLLHYQEFSRPLNFLALEPPCQNRTHA